MMTSRIFRVLATVIAWGALACAQNAPKVQPSITVAIAAPQTVVKLGDPIVLRITETNISGHDLQETFSPSGLPGVALRRMDVKLYDSEGKPVEETDYGGTIHMRPRHGNGPAFYSGFGGTVLKAGDSFTEISDLNKEFVLEKAGKYTVQAQEFDRSSKTLVKSETITLTLTD